MNTAVPKLRFDKSGYYFTGLLLLVVLGFWKTYFSKFFNSSNDFSFYFHFHAVMMLLWVAMLIMQPVLIRKKKLHLHRLIGKASYIIMPVLLLSVLLILNSGLKGTIEQELSFSMILFPFRDFFLLAIAFIIAVIFRHNIQVHARAMVITGLIFIEPALFRFLGGVVFKGMAPWGFYTGAFLIVSLLTAIIVIERKQKKARWLFPSFLIVDLLVYAIVIFQIELSFMDPLVIWFSRLPLT